MYNYDSFGNMLLQDNLNTALNGHYGIDPATNRLLLNAADLQYASSGELLHAPYHDFLYYPDGLLRCIDLCQSGSYLVNGSGERVFSANAQRTQLSMYFGGQALAEYNQTTDTWSDYIMAGGQRIAKVDTHAYVDTTHYYLDDQLGTAQLELDTSGSVTARLAFTPFGQEVVNGSDQNLIGPQPGDGTAMHFEYTGLEGDSESGLDHATFRNYGPMFGRWMSPDPYDGSMDPGNPQSMNRYAYVGNMPLMFTDPSGLTPGHDVCGIGKKVDGSTGVDSEVGLLECAGEIVLDFLTGIHHHPQFTASHVPRPSAQDPKNWLNSDTFAVPYQGLLRPGVEGGGCEFGGCNLQSGPAAIGGAVAGTAVCELAEPCGAIEDIGLISEGALYLYKTHEASQTDRNKPDAATCKRIQQQAIQTCSAQYIGRNDPESPVKTRACVRKILNAAGCYNY